MPRLPRQHRLLPVVDQACVDPFFKTFRRLAQRLVALPHLDQKIIWEPIFLLKIGHQLRRVPRIVAQGLHVKHFNAFVDRLDHVVLVDNIAGCDFNRTHLFPAFEEHAALGNTFFQLLFRHPEAQDDLERIAFLFGREQPTETREVKLRRKVECTKTFPP